VYYTSPITQVIQPGQGTVGTAQIQEGAVTNTKLDVASLTGTGAAQMPVGTTAERPTGAAGYFRLNSTSGFPEWYDTSTSTWQAFSYNTYDTVNYLIVAGGGGGASGWGNIGGGGGGAGGYVAGTFSLVAGTSYTVIVGAGGAGAPHASGAEGVSGSNSSFTGLTTAIGGGFSKSWITGNTAGASGSGGSGGGGTYFYITPGSGTSGQGFAGGLGIISASCYGGGGGGGASAVGADGSGASGGNGGAGSNWQSLGTFYAGGGGGGSQVAPSGSGGSSVGGNGGYTSLAATAGAANRGGGGGGGGGSGVVGASGGSGIVIIRYPGTQRATGGTVTSAGGYTYHTFTTSGTFTA
jgi:hypothetical protein